MINQLKVEIEELKKELMEKESRHAKEESDSAKSLLIVQQSSEAYLQFVTLHTLSTKLHDCIFFTS